jgi:large subunit ribosomal protein L30
LAPKKKLAVTLVKSYIGYSYRQRQVVKGLGLRRLWDTVIREDTPAIRGMIQKISHLLKVKEAA